MTNDDKLANLEESYKSFKKYGICYVEDGLQESFKNMLETESVEYSYGWDKQLKRYVFMD